MPSRDTLRWLQTVNLNFIAVTYGMAIAVYGATLVDVADIYRESIRATSITLTARGLGSVFSSLIGALVYKFVNLQVVLMACVIFGAISALLTTVLPSIIYLHVLTFFVGCSMGFMEIGIHVWLQVIWKERSGSFFHFMNFMFGFGGIVGPFICEPFLRGMENDSRLYENVTASKAEFSSVSIEGNVTQLVNGGTSPERSGSRIFTAFCIIAAIHGINALSMIIPYCMDSSDFKASKETSYFKRDLPKHSRRTVLALLALYLTVGVTCEFGFSSMVFTFAVSHPSLHFTKSQAAFLTSLFWASYTVSRIVTTGLSLKFGVAQLIVGSHFIYVTSVVLMMFFLDTSPALVTWLGTALVAFGLSPYWSNGTAWSVLFIQLTPGSVGLIMVLISSGVMLIPFIVVSRISENPQFFLYSNTGLALLLTAVAAALILYGNTKALKKHKKENKARNPDLS
ncbi:sodium-dependent glucose transporter 1 [Galendromus occidentalis]|uniref:Sodium-dependent glucose transporter 1 n=1 Tax=Galendromus occidentalis TaxID=34638 RepID=A0AAJ6QYK5_9ACAR|nr:sodium-dependent glucose transporter 1 [Galendromus occidentalis]